LDKIRETLKTHFGLDHFREPQEEIISNILKANETMVIMPTGGGKSLCFQLPAILFKGVTIVVSPLIALIKDQVDSLQAKGLPAAGISSLLSPSEQRSIIDGMAQGKYKLIYIAPERFRSARFIQALKDITISLLAIDEAHCISQWGHDFRPDYMKLGSVIQSLKIEKIAAFTATATPEVRADIQKNLGFKNPKEFVSGFARKNLRFQITVIDNEDHKYQRLNTLIMAHKTGIIYCATRKNVEAVQEVMKELGHESIAYHGGLNEFERNRTQDIFIQKKSNLVIATNAFGMGIDRDDIRFVAHFDMPGSVEAYYQEAGRAGRDGKESVCEMLFNYADKRVQEFFIEGSNPGTEVIRDTYKVLTELADNKNVAQVSMDTVKDSFPYKVNPMAISTAISILVRQNCIERFDIPGIRIRGTRILDSKLRPTQIQLDEEALKEKEARDRGKLKSVIQLAYARNCRQQWILHYFGEKKSQACQKCDNCNNNSMNNLREANKEEAIIVLKALSGIARMSEKVSRDYWKPKYGRNKILQCLMGSESESIKSGGLQNLSTYGILKDEGRRYLNELFDELEKENLIETIDNGDYPLLSLSAYGLQVMRKEENYKLSWPIKNEMLRHRSSKEQKAFHQSSSNEMDLDLLKKLKLKRTQLANARGGVPPYTIFTNQVLESLAIFQPRSLEEAVGIKGIGKINGKRNLPTFIKMIRNHTQSTGNIQTDLDL
jgi:ATP-dependent DNA helicase RecQ